MTRTGITIYDCLEDEAALFQAVAARFDVALTITDIPVSEANIDLARGNHCISVSHKTPLTNSVLHALSQAGVRYISTRSAGYDHIDIKFAASVGITVGNVRYSPDSVADYTIMLMLLLLRDAKSTISRTNLQDFRLNTVRGKELRDLTIGVIGTGRIGAAVIKRLHGFGGRVVAYDHHPKTVAEYVSLYELLRRSDIITLHTPLSADTHHLLNQERIDQMKDGALVVNTGRGPLIATEALIAALETGKLGGAALDVLEGEEGIFYTDYREKTLENKLLSRLLQQPNTIITPHTAYYTDHALRDMVENTITNCLKFKKENIS